jgi:hypothetical protein
MFHAPHPDLNEEERALLGVAPEQCLRRAVQRGALSLDHITEQLTPRAAAVVRSMVTEERSPAPNVSPTHVPNAQETQPVEPLSMGAALRRIVIGDREPESSVEEVSSPSGDSSADRAEPEEAHNARWRATYEGLDVWPSLQHAVDEGTVNVYEAMAIAQTIDHTLGRYTTGTRYAAP